MRECHILRPELFALVQPLRQLLGGSLQVPAVAEVQLTLADQGVDVLLSDVKADGLEAAEALPRFGEDHRLARLSVDDGYGAETRYEPVPVTVTLSGVPVVLPTGAFLQATEDGERALIESVREVVGSPGRTADLFAGSVADFLERGPGIVARRKGRSAAHGGREGERHIQPVA